MAHRSFEAARGLGIWIPRNLAQRSSRYNLTAVKSRARPEIDDVIRVPHCFFVVLDNNQ
jgi:hypothetical protein